MEGALSLYILLYTSVCTTARLPMVTTWSVMVRLHISVMSPSFDSAYHAMSKYKMYMADVLQELQVIIT